MGGGLHKGEISNYLINLISNGRAEAMYGDF